MGDRGKRGGASEKDARRSTLRSDALNLPNLLTFLRVLLIPVVLWLLSQGSRESGVWAAIVYGVTAITDFFDGWLARRQGLTSVLGKFLDPLADKLLVMAVLVYLVQMGRVPAWAAILVVARELSVNSLRVIAMTEGVVIAAGQGGKEKTFLQMLALLMLILHFPYTLYFGLFTVHADFNAVGLLLLYLSVLLALTSAGEYLRLFVAAVEAKGRRDGESKPPAHNP